MISIFAARIARGERPVIYGDGKQTRDFVYVTDVARAGLLVCEQEAAVGGVFNVAGGRQTNMLQLAAVLNQVLDTSLTPTFAPARSGEVRFSQANVSRAREVLGWEAQITLQEGLSRLMQAEYK